MVQQGTAQSADLGNRPEGNLRIRLSQALKDAQMGTLSQDERNARNQDAINIQNQLASMGATGIEGTNADGTSVLTGQPLGVANTSPIQPQASGGVTEESGLNIPTPEERQAQIRAGVEELRGRVDQDRQAGREQGQELFGEGSLGRIPEDTGSLGRARALAEERAGGLSDEERQLITERETRAIDSASMTALRTLRGIQSGAGMRGATAEARETDILKERMRSMRDLNESVRLMDFQREQQGLQQFGQLASQEQEFLNRAREFNIGIAGSEKERALQTEISNVGLGIAQESAGSSQVLQALNLDFQTEFAKEQLALSKEELAKPAPQMEAPSGGMSAVCTEMHRQGFLSDEMFHDEQWAVDLIVDDNMIRGYHVWAVPLVGVMKKSKIVTALLKPLVRGWATYMTYKIGKTEKYSLVGSFIYNVGGRICRLIGRFV